MRLFRSLLVIALLGALPGDSPAAPKVNPKALPKKAAWKHSVHGLVVKVKRDGDKDNGSFTLRTHRDKDDKKAKKDKDDFRTFQVLPGVTKFYKVHDGKRHAASFEDLHKGQHVSVHHIDDRPHLARTVLIKVHHHPVRGVVREVKRDEDGDNGSITLRTHRDKDDKKAKKDKDDFRTFQVLPGVTKFYKLHEGKRAPATFRDVREGEHAIVTPLDDRPAFAHAVAIVRKDR